MNDLSARDLRKYRSKSTPDAIVYGIVVGRVSCSVALLEVADNFEVIGVSILIESCWEEEEWDLLSKDWYCTHYFHETIMSSQRFVASHLPVFRNVFLPSYSNPRIQPEFVSLAQLHMRANPSSLTVAEMYSDGTFASIPADRLTVASAATAREHLWTMAVAQVSFLTSWLDDFSLARQYHSESDDVETRISDHAPSYPSYLDHGSARLVEGVAVELSSYIGAVFDKVSSVSKMPVPITLYRLDDVRLKSGACSGIDAIVIGCRRSRILGSRLCSLVTSAVSPGATLWEALAAIHAIPDLTSAILAVGISNPPDDQEALFVGRRWSLEQGVLCLESFDLEGVVDSTIAIQFRDVLYVRLFDSYGMALAAHGRSRSSGSSGDVVWI